MKKLPFFLFLVLLAAGLNAQRTVRILVLNHSTNPPKSEKGVTITPLTGGGNAGSTNDAGLFDINLSTAKPGDRLDLIVNKPDYQILGPDPRIFNYAVPNDANEYVRIAIIKASDFNASKADFEVAIEKRIKLATSKLDRVIDSLQKAVNDDVRNALAKTIKTQSDEINELRKNKEELATRFAQVDLEQASEFARLALKKFKEEGDVKAALAMMPEDKLGAFWDNVLLQEEKVKKAREQGVENYMIRAKLLIADFQFSLAYKTYQEAIRRDSTNAQNLWVIAYFLDKQENNPDAIKLYNQALKFTKSKYDSSAILFNLGNIYSLHGKHGEAEKNYTTALINFRKLAISQPEVFLENVAMALNNLGLLYESMDKPTKAESYYLEALEIRRNLGNKNPELFLSDLTSSLLCLGSYYVNIKDSLNAKKFIIEAININKKFNTKNPNAFLSNLAKSLLNLGDFYLSVKDIDAAEKNYLEAITIYRNITSQSPNVFFDHFAMTLRHLGNLYKDSERTEEAEKVYLEEKNMCEKFANQNPDVFLYDLAYALGNLGYFYEHSNKKEKSKEILSKAIDIYRKLVEQDPDKFLAKLASTLNSLGDLYKDSQRIEEAEKLYLEELDIQRKLAVQNPDKFLPELASALNSLGDLYKDSQKAEEAEKLYLEELDIQRKLAVQNPDEFLPELASALNSLGDLYKDSQRIEEAEKLYLEELDIQRKLAVQNPDKFLSELATALSSLGDFYKDSQKMEEAEKFYLEELDIRRKLAVQNPDEFLSELATALNSLGIFYVSTQSMEEAEKYIIEAIEIYRILKEDRAGFSLSDLSTALTLLSMVYISNNKSIEAEKICLESIEISKGLYDADHKEFISLATALNFFGMISEYMQRLKQAKKAYIEALNINFDVLSSKKTNDLTNFHLANENLKRLIDSFLVDKDIFQIIEITEILATKWEALIDFDSSYAKNAANELGSLAWYQLFAKHYIAAQTAAEKGLHLDPTQTWIYTNLAHMSPISK